MSELAENTQELQRVKLQLKKQNSLVQGFMRGMVAALGATVGLSIFLGLLALLINYFAKVLGVESIIQPVLQNLNGGK